MEVLLSGDHPTAHKVFAIVATDDYSEALHLMRSHMHGGDVDVRPVNDIITIRKNTGDWESNLNNHLVGRAPINAVSL